MRDPDVLQMGLIKLVASVAVSSCSTVGVYLDIGVSDLTDIFTSLYCSLACLASLLESVGIGTS